jgi:hypothetical protein
MELVPVSLEIVERRIFVIRNTRVMLDFHLAELYEVETKYLTRQVRRNQDRFPEDFCFTLTRQEFTGLKCQFGTSKGRGGRTRPPLAFTEQGVAMLSGVLNGPKAIHVNILIMRAFVQLRSLLESNQELRKKLNELENSYDEKFKVVFAAIRALMEKDAPVRRRIGFRVTPVDGTEER